MLKIINLMMISKRRLSMSKELKKTLATMALVSLGTWVLISIISNFSCEQKQ